MKRIRNPGRRALRAQLESRYFRVLPGDRRAPIHINILGGQMMRVDRGGTERAQIFIRKMHQLQAQTRPAGTL